MKEIASVSLMRRSDENTIRTKIPSLDLMYRAGVGIFESVNWHGKILIVCGTGNNAGDGYVVASLLKSKGFFVELLLLAERFSPDGKYYFDRCVKENVPWSVYNSQNLEGYDIIVDCIFGTGFKGKAENEAKDVIEKINKSGAYVVCADINSGLNGDSGLGEACVVSNLTVSVGSLKSGHFLGRAKDVIGRLVNIDIGIDLIEKPYYLLEAKDTLAVFKERPNFSHKGTYGYITLIGGSTEYSGAVKLANIAASAMRAGAGVVKLAVPKSLCGGIMPYILESTLCPMAERDGAICFDEDLLKGALSNIKAASIGMGLGTRGDNRQVIEYILNSCQIPVIIDADGLRSFSEIDKNVIRNSKSTVVLTPHLKEFERLCGVPLTQIQENPIELAKSYAKEMGVILLLKGQATVITDGEEVIISATGCAGMATAGSGDVLSGILAAVCAYSDNTLMAVSSGAYINGLAGELAQAEFGDISMVASDTASYIPRAIKKIKEHTE